MMLQPVMMQKVRFRLARLPWTAEPSVPGADRAAVPGTRDGNPAATGRRRTGVLRPGNRRDAAARQARNERGREQ